MTGEEWGYGGIGCDAWWIVGFQDCATAFIVVVAVIVDGNVFEAIVAATDAALLAEERGVEKSGPCFRAGDRRTASHVTAYTICTNYTCRHYFTFYPPKMPSACRASVDISADTFPISKCIIISNRDMALSTPILRLCPWNGMRPDLIGESLPYDGTKRTWAVWVMPHPAWLFCCGLSSHSAELRLLNLFDYV